MLSIFIKGKEQYNEATGEFVNTVDTVLNLEHSLISISKWEAKWHKPFLSRYDKKTMDETLDYVRCMTINKNVDESIYTAIDGSDIAKINSYIENPMTATRLPDIGKKSGGNSEIITSELIYYWMLEYKIPIECEKWHLNRLLTLVKVCEFKNTPAKKMSKTEIMNRNKVLNEQRKQQLQTKG